MSYDFNGLNQRLLTQIDELMDEWLPGGRWQGPEYVCADFSGGTGRSMSVNRRTGKWSDFAQSIAGGDLISLYAAIRGVDQGESYRLLAGEPTPAARSNGKRYEPKAPLEVHKPPNVDFSLAMFSSPTSGTPSQIWIYRDGEGEPIMVTARYEHAKGKIIKPWVYDGLRWVSQAHPIPRPLYGYDRLARFNNPVLLVEGEKTADAAQYYFPTRPCMTWCGGCGQWAQADWAQLAGRAVTVWPDNDAPGKSTALKIAGKLVALKCTVTMIDPLEYPEGWDLADALADNVPKSDLLAYVKGHSRPIQPLAIPEKRKAAPAVYEQKPVNGSMYETWQRHDFVLRSNGRPYSNHVNVGCAIRSRGDLDIYYEEFTQRIMIGDQPWTEAHAGDMTVWLQRNMGMPDVSPPTVHRGVEIYALSRRRNALTDWLHQLVWDGEPRVDLLISTGFGVRDSAYARAVGRNFMVSMVARALQPGCKADCMPVFEGAQGAFKSSALSIIGGDYFVEIHENVNHKDFYLCLRGKLLGEIAEMEAFSRADIRKVKNIMSTRTDTYRKPYEREAADHPRTCLFAGTTNSDDWNTDDTGARRFWPIRCGRIDRDWLRENRSQLFAEAVQRFEAGEDWWTVPDDAAERQREARRMIDPWENLIMTYARARESVQVDLILANCLDMRKQDVTRAHSQRVCQILRANGWDNRVRYVNGKVERKWRPNSDSLPDVITEEPRHAPDPPNSTVF